MLAYQRFTPAIRVGCSGWQYRHWRGGFYPAGRIAEPEDVVRAAIFLASDEAKFTTASVLHVDGGFVAR